MSKSWCACFTSETRHPDAVNRGTSASIRVVLPLPDQPANPNTRIELRERFKCASRRCKAKRTRKVWRRARGGNVLRAFHVGFQGACRVRSIFPVESNDRL